MFSLKQKKVSPLGNLREIAPGIVEGRVLLPIDKIMEALAKMDYWNRGLVNAGNVSPNRTSDYAPLKRASDDFDHLVFCEMNKLIKEYQCLYPYALINEDEGYLVNRYEVGQEYKVHADWSIENRRVVSAVVFLNDDYQGGELVFDNFKLKIRPEAGKIILFPSCHSYTHASLPVTRGTKYSLVTWFR
jgi:predicted 2-oxoglutarate/Fe(II)-dependent dioxygenase YbiX